MIQQSKKTGKNAQNAEGVSVCALEISSPVTSKKASKATIGAMVALLLIGADFFGVDQIRVRIVGRLT